MDQNKSHLFCFILYLLIPRCLTDLTGLHYLNTTDCSAPGLYIPQGPYLFSHHWPFISLTIQYHRRLYPGVCQQDGSLYFLLNNNTFCFGNYYDGYAKLFCQSENDEHCLVDMRTSDESRLSCY